MSTSDIKRVSEVDPEEFVGVYNRAFSDYLVPAPPATLASLDETKTRCDVAAEFSYVAFRNGRAAGFALVALRPGRGETRSHVYSMGVVSEHRRSGLGAELLVRVVEDARARGSSSVSLEVVAGNAAALRFYERGGFSVRRELLGYSIDREEMAAPRASLDLKLRQVAAADCAEIADQSLGVTLPWQLHPATLVKLPPSFSAYLLEIPGATVGYAVLGARSDGWRWLFHLAIRPQYRRHGLGASALARLAETDPEMRRFRLLPFIPDSLCTLREFLAALGFHLDPVSQCEMWCPL